MTRSTVRFAPGGAKYQRVREEIANQLRELIACGKLRRGDKLPAERQLAEVLGVSRHSVREAIRSLEQQGVLASRRGDGTYVLDDRQELLYGPLGMAVEQRNIQEVLEFRKLLEPQIASLAARNITDEDISLLREKLNEQKAVIAEGGSGSAHDAEFHLLIAKATGNRVLYEVLIRIHDIVSESRDFTLQTEERRDWAVMTHERVLEALVNRDPEAAFREMHAHIDYVEQIALQWID